MNARKPTSKRPRTVSRRPTRARNAAASAAAHRLQTRTAKSQGRFLAAFARTGNISASCHSAGVGRRTIYDWQHTDADFAAKYSEAKEQAIDALELEARRRAMLGTLRPIYQNGKRVGAVREFSDTLMVTLLKAARPNVYRDNVHHKIGGRLKVQALRVQAMSDKELRNLTEATAVGGAIESTWTDEMVLGVMRAMKETERTR